MQPYANLNGDSGVVAFEINESSIIVLFNNGKHYEYNEIRPGTATVERMKALALSGRGLGSYIARVVQKNFFRKF